MKAPGFWYPPRKKRGLAAWAAPVLLSPFSLAFHAGTALRRGFAKPYQSRVPVICVGNAVAGGAGKTPTALTIARMLKQRGEKPVFVSRGYGGNGQNLCVDPARHSAADVGDEALLLAAFAPTWVGADRVEAVCQAESHGTCIVMDDGLQNPYIAPTVAVLVIDGEAGIGNGHVIPAGPLRESFAAAMSRAAAVVMIGKDAHHLKHRVKIPFFHAHLRPRLPPGFPRKSRFIAFAGIGRPEKFYDTARELKLDLADTIDFADHHLYTQADIDVLRLRAEEKGARLLTTEKDAVRLPPAFRADCLVLPVALTFDHPEDEGAFAHLCFDLC